MSEFGIVFVSDETNPISAAAVLAANRNWDFKQQSEDELSIALEGQWKIYSTSLCWSDSFGILSVECSYEVQIEPDCISEFLTVLNLANMRTSLGSFAYEEDLESVVYSYRLAVWNGAEMPYDHVERILDAVVEDCDRFYPSLDMVVHGVAAADDSILAAIVETRGSA